MVAAPKVRRRAGAMAKQMAEEKQAWRRVTKDLICYRHPSQLRTGMDQLGEREDFWFNPEELPTAEECSVDATGCVLVTSRRTDGRHQLVLDIDGDIGDFALVKGHALYLPHFYINRDHDPFVREIERLGIGKGLPEGFLLFDGAFAASGTWGHFHAYSPMPLTWEQVRHVAAVAADVGLADKYWVDHSDTRGFLSLRHPAHPKRFQAGGGSSNYPR